MFRIIIIFSLSLLVTPIAWAWNFDAHHVIAEIAYQNLTAKTKRRVLKHIHILAQHYPRTSFAMSASWADRIRFHDVEAFSQWHYTDIPIVRDGVEVKPHDAQDIIWAVEQAERVLRSKKSNDFEKAFFLRFYLHLVGDIHQPLHCASLHSKQFPAGDRGGNLFAVTYQGYRSNLHVVWDRAGGRLKKTITHKRGLYLKSVKKMAGELQQQFPKQQFRQQLTLGPRRWAQESQLLAQRVAYQVTPEQTLSPSYLKRVQSVSEQRMVLAGYRLASRLNEIYADNRD